MSVDVGELVKVAGAVFVSVLGSLQVLNRKNRARVHVRENLELLQQLRQDSTLSGYPFVEGWLAGEVVVGVARLTGQKLGSSKKPIPWGSIVTAAAMGLGFAYFANWLSQGTWKWTALFPGIAAGLMAVAIMGMLTDRKTVDDPNLPKSAARLNNQSPEGEVATVVAASVAGADPTIGEEGSRVDVAFKFVEHLVDGDFEGATKFAEENWVRCRVQAWLWNNRVEYGAESLAALTESLVAEHQPDDVWGKFVASESAQFKDAWAGYGKDHLGVATHRRRLSRDYDLVILPVMPEGGAGYVVMERTALPNALQLLLHEVECGWLVANHVGLAPPVPGLPPTWWSQGDQVFNELPE